MMEETPFSTRAMGVRNGVLWSERDEIYWTASASADGANGPNCKSLAGLDVEKLRGEGTSP